MFFCSFQKLIYVFVSYNNLRYPFPIEKKKSETYCNRDHFAL